MLNNTLKHLEVRKKYQDFLEWVFQKISRFPKTQKFILGEEIGKLALKILEGLIVIQFSPQSKREELLKKINLKLETFRSLMKLAYQMGFMGKKGFLYQEVKVNEIGRMVYGLVSPKSKSRERRRSDLSCPVGAKRLFGEVAIKIN